MLQQSNVAGTKSSPPDKNLASTEDKLDEDNVEKMILKATTNCNNHDNNKTNLILSNTNNSTSNSCIIDSNNRNLIKSKSITGIYNDENDDVNENATIQNENEKLQMNSINDFNKNNLNIRANNSNNNNSIGSSSTESKNKALDVEDELNSRQDTNKIENTNSEKMNKNLTSGNDSVQQQQANQLESMNDETIFNLMFGEENENDLNKCLEKGLARTMVTSPKGILQPHPVHQQNNTLSSSCSSTSNETRGFGGGGRGANESEEEKLLNVIRRSTNPFLNDVIDLNNQNNENQFKETKKFAEGSDAARIIPDVTSLSTSEQTMLTDTTNNNNTRNKITLIENKINNICCVQSSGLNENPKRISSQSTTNFVKTPPTSTKITNNSSSISSSSAATTTTENDGKKMNEKLSNHNSSTDVNRNEDNNGDYVEGETTTSMEEKGGGKTGGINSGCGNGGISISCIEDYNGSLVDYDNDDSDEFCKSEIFDNPMDSSTLAREYHKRRKYKLSLTSAGGDESYRHCRKNVDGLSMSIASKSRKLHQRRKSNALEKTNHDPAIAVATSNLMVDNNGGQQIPDNCDIENEIPSTIDDNLAIVKSAIPTCSFERQDYGRPGERPHNVDDNTLLKKEQLHKYNKRLLMTALSLSNSQANINNNRKKGDLFHFPSFGSSKNSKTPSLKNANLNYPNKTCNTDNVVVDCTANDKKYFEKIQSKAKYQLIKLGQKCKILNQSPAPGSSTKNPIGNVKTTIIKTNSNHRKKYQYYNEINKSYQLDDFIKSTNLLNEQNCDEFDLEPNDGNGNRGGGNGGRMFYGNEQSLISNNNNCNNDGRKNSVVYKTYKSEIDLTRNLTYLDAFLNENFDREPAISSNTSKKLTKSKSHSNHHKRAKSCSKNINYMVNNESDAFNYNEDTNDANQKKSINYGDDNVTSSSFEYQSTKDKKPRKDYQSELMSGEKSGRSNTTSSSLSSSDYASVYSGPTNGSNTTNNGNGVIGANKTKLITTPEESLEYYDRNFVEYSPRPTKKKTKSSHNDKRLFQSAAATTSSGSTHNNPPHYLNDEDLDLNAIDFDESLLLFDENNFVELKENLKKFHPNVYNSVPQFEELNAIDFYENPEYHQFNGDTDQLFHPYENKNQLSSSYNNRNSHPQDYLEHFNIQQHQQLLSHDDTAIADDIHNKYSFGTSSRSKLPLSQATATTTAVAIARGVGGGGDYFYNSQTLSSNDIYSNRKYYTGATIAAAVAVPPVPTPSSSSSSYVPHRVIVSKSKKQKGELVLEYEC